MSDRASHLRDRTLVLRILVPSLQAALRDKMTEREEEAANRAAETSSSSSSSRGDGAGGMGLAGMHSHPHSGGGGGGGGSGGNRAPTSQVLELDGVSCEPSEDGSTLWHFHCDGASYPARLVNLPCPVELHKTFDHATYYKCSDVGQILIVYEDDTHLEEAESVPGYRTEGYPSYYHSGLTPPMKRVVQRRFNAREHNSVAPPRSEVSAVERELKELIEKTTKDAKGKGKGGGAAGQTVGQGKVLEEVVEDVVDYEPWMDDNGRVPYGVEFDEKDVMCTKHPEVWLDPNDVKEEERLREEMEKKRKAEEEEKARLKAELAAASKKAATSAAAAPTKTKSKKKDGPSPLAGAAPAAASATTTTKKKKKKKKGEDKKASSSSPTPDGRKKGIAAKKNREVDEVTQAAAQIASGMEGSEYEALEGLFDFDEEDGTLEGMDLGMDFS